jgi:5-methylcytosine-specific restriction protein A
MIKVIKQYVSHYINIVRGHLRDIGVKQPRSPHWSAVEKAFRKDHPECAACGSIKHLNVHHIKPFHLFPELELDPTNLITLCMDTLECHLQVGHLGNFKKFNINVRNDAASIRTDISQFDQIVKNAKNNQI